VAEFHSPHHAISHADVLAPAPARPSPRQFSKIGKVMRHINALSADKVPRDDEFKFRDRAKTLVDKWHEIASSNKVSSEGTIRKPATNGNGKPHVEDAGANGKEETNEKQETVAVVPSQEPAKMDVDAKEDFADAADAEEDKEKDAPAEDDTPAAANTADESAADVTMSEA
jgi:hypothetical protein